MLDIRLSVLFHTIFLCITLVVSNEGYAGTEKHVIDSGSDAKLITNPLSSVIDPLFANTSTNRYNPCPGVRLFPGSKDKMLGLKFEGVIITGFFINSDEPLVLRDLPYTSIINYNTPLFQEDISPIHATNKNSFTNTKIDDEVLIKNAKETLSFNFNSDNKQAYENNILKTPSFSGHDGKSVFSVDNKNMDSVMSKSPSVQQLLWKKYNIRLVSTIIYCVTPGNSYGEVIH